LQCELLERIRGQPGGESLLAAAHEGVHLVGGAVRDILRGDAPRELDVVVEGELERLLAALGGEVLTHERFGTATVTIDGSQLDIARARRELYRSPGALPDVEPAPLAVDLLRRDFTVNAIAVSLAGPNAGELVLVDHAREDLQAGRLRVLHERSFHDDPTRLLRLARYRSRLGFDVEQRTGELAAEALASGAIATLSGARLGAELRLALSEPDPPAAIAALAELGVLGALDPSLGFAEPLARRALAALPADGRADLLLLAAIMLSVAAPAGEEPGQAIAALLDRLQFSAADRERVLATALLAPLLPERLRGLQTPSQLRQALQGATLEAVALAVALCHEQGLGPAADGALRWLTDVRHVRLAITGDDLLAAGIAPGPDVGRRLELALRRKLDGELAEGAQAELSAALEQP